MALTAGTMLGQYEIRAPLGAGGMGEVYRAHDTRLDREVAIKVLPEYLTSDPDRLRRFEQEARATAALNHPNILVVYQMATDNGISYLVEELLDGETLRERLRRGPIPLRKAIEYAVQIAHGIAAAHDKGISHRDLKPENLFLTKDGRIKILDFGLARLVPSKEASGEEATVTERTDPGVVLGTAGYMSPEQVRGQTVDHRTDIFAFGTVLYEMVTGKQPFRKPTSADTMAAILNEDPPSLSQISASTPPGLQRVVHRCLEKDPEQRFHSAHDLAFALEALSESGISSPSAARSQVRAQPNRLRIAAAAVVLLVALAIGSGWWVWAHRPSEKHEAVQRQLTASTSDNPVTSASISHDGRYLSFSDSGGIAIQEIENGETHRLPGTTRTDVKAWYPDGLHLLVLDDKYDLSTLFVASGEKRKLASHVIDAALSSDGSQIAFSREQEPNELWTVPGAGGEPQVRVKLGNDQRYMAPAWSPDGKSIAYIRYSYGINDTATLEIRDLADGKSRVLLADPSLPGGGTNSVLWLPDGRILFGIFKEGSTTRSDLWALSLDSSGAVTGKPTRLTNTTGTNIDGLSASANGKRLAILFQRLPLSIFVAELNEAGEKLEHEARLTNDSWSYRAKSWTPDSQTLFYESLRHNQGIYKRSLSPGTETALLAGPEDYEMWGLSQDGMWYIVTASPRVPGKWRLLRVPVAGGAPETILTPAGVAEVHCAPAGSRACVLSETVGKQMTFSTVDPVRGRLQEIAKVETQSELSADWRLSPDGSKIALVENLGDNVRILNLQGKELQVIHPMPPQKGLQTAAWSADGKRFYLSAFPDNRGQLLEMDAAGNTRLLLENPNWIGPSTPSPDGKRIAYTYSVTESNVTLLEHF
jgi:eukaryotic-like serine/threonine-protein kinase